ncbi:uncharacterized protein Dwil_GK19570 [Drosophila willistoni]|uniref:CAAX prenyl protease n=1 Tax=Drosophila willistoni TaxID=7260 RepID=B4MNG6_DROWI|nr:CAAX prenyl protease 1 homolog [Drosophila willistoni]EDW73655.1 uncharacterized protein Dwil_GK19570 [Drosophila willistoni]
MSANFWNDPDHLLHIIITILIVDNLWSLYLLLREIRMVYRVVEVPEVISPYLPQELFERMRKYKLHKSWFTVVNTLVFVITIGVIELYFGFYGWLWNLATKCAVAPWMEHETVVSILFILFLSTYMTIKALPGHLYETYCIPSVQTKYYPPLGKRILKEVIEIILWLMVMIVLVLAIVYSFIAFGNYALLGMYLLSIVFTIILILIVPFLIDPCIGHRVPLEESALRTEMERLTEAVGFPIEQVHIIQVNDPNTGSNAFFYGCCCLKRIVIFDTLLLNRGQRNTSDLLPHEVGKGLRDNQVIAVVSHELGHWMHGHFYRAIILFKIHILLTFLLFALCFSHGPIYQAMGFEPGVQPIIVGFVVMFGFVLTPYTTLANFVLLTNTRHFEYQADSFAYELGYDRDLREALLKLYADNLTYPITDPCYSCWNHTHPTILDRLERLESLERGERFS